MEPHHDAGRVPVKAKCGRRPRGTVTKYFRPNTLKNAREAVGISVHSICDKLAEQGLPISRPTYYGLEHSRQSATLPIAQALCAMLNMNFDAVTTDLKPSSSPTPQDILAELENIIAAARKDLGD